ncbi:L-alanine exporter AlaE [Leucothrix sargassi]|nr:L-alanine exporter AlaE [Leucothrix sargassi]
MRSFIVDSVATVVFFTILAALTEIFIAGMALNEVLLTRLIMIPMMLLTGRPYGIWRDWLFNKVKPIKSWSTVITDSLAFMSFQLPIYVITLVIAGASWSEILTLMATVSGIMLVISRPFGMYLDYVRAWAGVEKASN